MAASESTTMCYWPTSKPSTRRSKAKKRFALTTDSRHKLPIAAKLIERDFNPAQPDQVWTSDITYIDTDEGWLFLMVMIDLFSR
jgi:putative transposase